MFVFKISGIQKNQSLKYKFSNQGFSTKIVVENLFFIGLVCVERRVFQYINTVILDGNPMLALGRKNIFEVGKKYRINLRLTKEYES